MSPPVVFISRRLALWQRLVETALEKNARTSRASQKVSQPTRWATSV
jgi:hypothetical protein